MSLQKSWARPACAHSSLLFRLPRARSLLVLQVHQNRRVPLRELRSAIARNPRRPFSNLAFAFSRNTRRRKFRASEARHSPLHRSSNQCVTSYRPLALPFFIFLPGPQDPLDCDPYPPALESDQTVTSKSLVTYSLGLNSQFYHRCIFRTSFDPRWRAHWPRASSPRAFTQPYSWEGHLCWHRVLCELCGRSSATTFFSPNPLLSFGVSSSDGQ